MPRKSSIFVESMFFIDSNFDEIKDRLTFRHNVLLFAQSKRQEQKLSLSRELEASAVENQILKRRPE